MSDEIILFLDNSLTFQERFNYLLYLLITNQSTSRLESLLFFICFYIQMISGFFSKKIGVFKPNESKSDKILNHLEKIFRFRGIFETNKRYFEASIIIIALFLLFHTCYLLILIYKTNRRSIYNKFKLTENILIKISYYILFNIILDIYSTFLCFGKEYNEFINDYKCDIKEHYFIFIIGTITVIYNICFTYFIQNYYRDIFYLSGNYYSQLLSHYHQYLILSNIIFSFTHSLISHLTNFFFLIITFVCNIFLFIYYYKHVVYYDDITNYISGAFHLMYIWTSVYCMIFYYINISEKGIFYIFTLLIILYIYDKMKTQFYQQIFYLTPFHKLKNNYYLLYYLKTLITIIYSDLSNIENKTLLIGIIQLHILECPIPNCITKTKQKLYIPNLNEWSDRTLPFLKDKVFLDSFIVNLMEFLIKYSTHRIELFLNFSYFHLNVTGNICQSIYLFEKAKHFEMSTMEKFAFERLKISICEKLVEKLKGKREFVDNLEGLNITYYFKYEHLKEKFIEEIFKDLELTIKFWKFYSKNENEEPIDFNYVFGITEKIKVCKNKVEYLWKKLFSIYSGINEIFYFYLDYVEQVNDDSFLKRELDEISRKFENTSGNFLNNLYNLMFRKETGIIIINGDRGKEGLIEKINHEFENNFQYSLNELRGMNISMLMPNIFAKEHSDYMKKYIQIGEKKFIDKKDNITFIKDKNNSLILVKINIKLFPVLNKNLYFIGLLIPEKIDDLILIDHNFIIQGMSKRLREKIQIENQYFFDEHEIPFYMLCKNFIQFYKVFMKGNRKKLELSASNNIKSDFRNSIISLSGNSRREEKKENIININSNIKSNNLSNSRIHANNNIEINENIELEYEIIIPKFILQFSKRKQFSTLIANKNQKSNHSLFSDISSNYSLDEKEFLIKGKEEIKNLGYTLQKKSESSSENNNDSNSYEEFEEEESKEENEEFIDNNVPEMKDIQRTILNDQFINAINIKNSKDFKKKKKNLKFNKNVGIKLSNKTMNETYIDNYKANYNKHHEINYNKLDVYYTPTPTPTPTPGNESPKLLNIKNKKLKKGHKVNNEFYFKEKLIHYRRLFLNENFNELEKSITFDTKDNEKIVYKFNFTFKKYLYNDNKISYIIRCIENKNLNGFSGSDDEVYNAKGTILHYQIDLFDELKNEYEIYEKEKEEINSNVLKFYDFSQENKEFQTKLIENKNNIKKYSRVLGLLKNRENGSFEDENASQTSVTSFNNDLSKINRILEIRESIIKNKKRLYTFNYIFIIAIIFFIGTVIFTILFYFIFNRVNQSLLELDTFHSNFYLIEILLCQIVSTLISLKTLFELNYYKDTFNFLTFTNNETEYFSKLTNEGILWYENSITLLNYLEINIHKFLEHPKEIFWNITEIGDFESILNGNDSEYYPLSLSTSLASANSLLKADFFSLSNTQDNLTKEETIEIYYLFFSTIDNTYDYVLPNTFGLNNLLMHLFQKYNDKKIKSILIILAIHMIFYFICLAVYLDLLIITNNHMGVGLEKILKISQEKINELILRIQNLEQYYHKKKENMKKIKTSDDSSDEEERLSKKLSKKKMLEMVTSETNPLLPTNSKNSEFNLDIKQNRKLNLQNKAYIHLAIIFIFGLTLMVITLIITKKVISSNNNILILQAGILGRILMATASTIYGKCVLAKCNISTSLDYTSFYNDQLIFQVYQAMEGLDEIYDFYHNYYIIDICSSAYDKNDKNYEQCKKQELPNSLNNTSDLIDYILNKVEDLISEANYSLSINSSYDIKNTFGSSTFSTLEESFYYYLIPVTERINSSILKSMENIIHQKRRIIFILICFFNIGVLIFILYVKYGFMRTFEYLLSISKCVIKIIPSSMICSNQDLENWLEKMNNNK